MEKTPLLSSGKTCPACSSQKTMPSDVSWVDWLAQISYYNRQGKDGQIVVMCVDDGMSRGESSMLNTSDSPNVVAESLLSQVLENNVAAKYSLSPKACAGILRRAEMRGRALPPTLKAALVHLANQTSQEH